ncbi:MAG: hypothetical protein IPH06_07135 [Alphaproteobacteria bacterium]|jgi:hypothetical protein|nr:hypothetical protein [Alphaproteobacteria bacterium]QQS57788.1 MAG: hypothetical protein IPN28_02895 [Alphaproteobacteria bacterium]
MKAIPAKALHLFFILTFVLAGISPACKFISGEKSFMEVCFSDGSLKRVEVPAEYNALLAKAGQTQQKQQDGHHKNADCAFCFAQSSLSKNTASSSVILMNPPGETLALGAGTFVLRGTQPSPFQSRGPPALS